MTEAVRGNDSGWVAAVALGGALRALLGVLRRRSSRAGYLRPFLGTGFLGAYTTYSTFAVETDLLAKNGHWGVAVSYTVASIVLGLAAVAGGLALVRSR